MAKKKKLDSTAAGMPQPNATLEAQIIAGEKEQAKAQPEESEEKRETRGRKTKLDSLFSDEIIGELLGYPFEVLSENFNDERFKLKDSQKQMFGYLIDATAAQANFRPSEYPQAFLLIFALYVGFEKYWVYKKYHSGHGTNSQPSTPDNGEVRQRQNDVYEKTFAAN